jgi:hypothetical protein
VKSCRNRLHRSSLSSIQAILHQCSQACVASGPLTEQNS